MAVGLQIKADTRAVRKRLERLAKVGGHLEPVLRQIGVDVRRNAQARLRARKSDYGPSSGRLSKSLTMSVSPRLVRVGSPLVYAAVQQLGHPGIQPKRGRYLAIPATTALRRRGVWPSDLPRGSMKFTVTQIVIGRRSWKGPALVDPASGEVMFALVKSVKIKGRAYLKFASREQAFALRAIRRHYLKAIGKTR